MSMHTKNKHCRRLKVSAMVDDPSLNGDATPLFFRKHVAQSFSRTLPHMPPKRPAPRRDSSSDSSSGSSSDSSSSDSEYDSSARTTSSRSRTSAPSRTRARALPSPSCPPPAPHTVLFCPPRAARARPFQLSVAIPADGFAQLRSAHAETYFAWDLARKLAAYGADEVVVYPGTPAAPAFSEPEARAGEAVAEAASAAIRLGRLLQYFEAPPGLRRATLPKHQDTRYAAGMPPVGLPHHCLVVAGDHMYAEGVVSTRSAPAGKSVVTLGPSAHSSSSSSAKSADVLLSCAPPAGTRVTVRLPAPAPGEEVWAAIKKAKEADAVAPSEPYGAGAPRWGFTVAVAESLAAVLSGESPAEPCDATVIVTHPASDSVAFTSSGARYTPAPAARPPSGADSSSKPTASKTASETSAATAAAVVVPTKLKAGFARLMLVLPPSPAPTSPSGGPVSSAAQLAAWGARNATFSGTVVAGAAAVAVAAAVGAQVHGSVAIKITVPFESLPLTESLPLAVTEAERKFGLNIRS